MGDAVSGDTDEEESPATTDEVRQYLEKPGTVALIAELYHYGQFTDLHDNVDIATGTLQRRLEEGQELGLVNLGDGSYPSANNYHLTEPGKRIYHELYDQGVLTQLVYSKRTRGWYEDTREWFFNWLESNPDEIGLENAEDRDEPGGME